LDLWTLQTARDRAGLAFDVTDSHTKSLRAKVKRFPARPVFLVTRIQPATSGADSAKQKNETEAEQKDAPTISVPADKQRVLLVEGPSVLTASLWEPSGGTVRCKVVTDEQGKIAELDSGAQPAWYPRARPRESTPRRRCVRI
jgi:hypothetical protein